MEKSGCRAITVNNYIGIRFASIILTDPGGVKRLFINIFVL
jgi:hypothetical protein